MPDYLTLIVFPLIVAVFALVIEYWIIHPLRNRQVNNSESSNEENSPFSLIDLVKLFLSLSGLSAFLFSIFIILGSLKSNQTFLSDTINNFPFQNLLENLLLSDVNISFAAILYTCIAFNVAGLRKNSPKWASIFTLFILPSVLLLLWAIVFLRDKWFSYIICLLLSNIWLIGGLLFSKTKDQDYSGHALVLSLLFFPTNALIFIYFIEFIPLTAWLLAIAILILDITMIAKLG